MPARGLTALLAGGLIALTVGASSVLGSGALTVTIASGPASVSTSADATFSFSANETATFTCSLDGERASACSSPKSYTGLAEGQHVFLVVATNSDRAGRTYTARDSRRWQVDLPAPAPTPVPPSRLAPLVVSVAGAGTVASTPGGVACPSDCTELFPIGATVTLVPSAAAGFGFAGWAGACTGTGACTPSIAGPTYVRASFTATAPAPPRDRGDHDADGVADSQDGCPQTPRRAKVLRAGCALPDLLRDDAVLLDPLAGAIGKAQSGLRAIDGLGPLARDLGHELELIRRGEVALQHGDVCGGAAIVKRGTHGLITDSKKAAKLVASRERAILALPPPEPDAGEKELEWAGLHYRARLVADVAKAAGGVEDVVTASCGGLGTKVVLVGRVKSTNDAEGWLELDDGVVVAFPQGHFDHRYGVGEIWESERVKVAAHKSRSGPWIAESVVGLLESKGEAKIAPALCVSLLIAPAQDFSEPTLILHDPAGYRSPSYGFDDLLWLEDGMRLAASPVKALPKCQSAKGRWSLEILLGSVTIAPDLDSADAPVPVAAGNSIPSLTVKERFQGSNCPPQSGNAQSGGQAPPQPLRRIAAAAKAFPCPAVVVATTTYHLVMRSPGSYAKAAYGNTVFHDPGESALQFTKVTGLASVHGTIANPSFEAEGYKQAGTGSTSSLVAIHQDETFALRPDSWYGAPLLFPLDAIGVDHIAGLVWPSVVGKRNGKPFRYRVALPNLVTDLLPGCPAKNCFYRLPWLFPGVIGVAQGNGPGAFSHNGAQQYAFDFSMSDKSTIYATRGGVVGDLVETNTLNFNPCADNNGNGIKGDEEDKKADGPTNYVRVDHLDGTYSYYAHVDTNSVVPQPGDSVDRGDPLAKVDNIGRSCGVHLHYQVAIDKTNTIYGQTTQICFEGWAFVIVDYLYSPCFVPKSGNLLLSSNG